MIVTANHIWMCGSICIENTLNHWTSLSPQLLKPRYFLHWTRSCHHLHLNWQKAPQTKHSHQSWQMWTNPATIKTSVTWKLISLWNAKIYLLTFVQHFDQLRGFLLQFRLGFAHLLHKIHTPCIQLFFELPRLQIVGHKLDTWKKHHDTCLKL